MGLTQEQLAENTRINIRTIQRIESGDVMPRSTTLTIILEILGLDFNVINGQSTEEIRIEKPDILKSAWIAGIVFTIIFGILIFLTLMRPVYQKDSIAHLMAILNIITSILVFFFNKGKIHVGKLFNNNFIVVTAIADMILFTVSNIVQISLIYVPSTPLTVAGHFLLSLIGLNGIFYGIGILLIKHFKNDLIMATGIVYIVESLLFVFPFVIGK